MVASMSKARSPRAKRKREHVDEDVDAESETLANPQAQREPAIIDGHKPPPRKRRMTLEEARLGTGRSTQTFFCACYFFFFFSFRDQLCVCFGFSQRDQCECTQMGSLISSTADMLVR